MDLHPYDGKERVFTHGDSDTSKGLELISGLIGVHPSIEGLEYSLSFYSGGIGIIDKLACSMPSNKELLNLVKVKLELLNPSKASQDEYWSDDFIWLVEDEDADVGIENHSMNFLNEHRNKFQSECTPNSDMYFVKWSNVNDWSAIYIEQERLNYVAYSCG